MKSSLSIDFRSYLKYRDTSLVLIPRWKRKCVAYWFQKPLLSQRRRRIVKASQKLSRERERERDCVSKYRYETRSGLPVRVGQSVGQVWPVADGLAA